MDGAKLQIFRRNSIFSDALFAVFVFLELAFDCVEAAVYSLFEGVGSLIGDHLVLLGDGNFYDGIFIHRRFGLYHFQGYFHECCGGIASLEFICFFGNELFETFVGVEVDGFDVKFHSCFLSFFARGCACS